LTGCCNVGAPRKIRIGLAGRAFADGGGMDDAAGLIGVESILKGRSIKQVQVRTMQTDGPMT
jgi:hypothetical protein